jgi:transposase
MSPPAVLVRIVGRPPLAATVFNLERLRCNLCGEIFTADPPDRAGPEKYDASAASMIACLKYGTGVPFFRLQRLQQNMGTPLPPSTAWGIVEKKALDLRPVYAELINQAAQGEVLYNDDTTMKILALMGKRARQAEPQETEKKEEEKNKTKKKSKKGGDPENDPDRTGIFTSGVVSTREGRKIVLFFTGRKHAGENLAAVLAHRNSELAPPIQMCDALELNQPRGFATILSNCLVHARRGFVAVAPSFPDECSFLLETLAKVYKHDDYCKEHGMSAEQRLAYHQENSAPLMKELEDWFTRLFAEHKVEPNSGLGKAIKYMQKRWDRLTLFLRQAGAPLDSNEVERALKMAILHRKNSLFYRSLNGAAVGDLFMSLIHTCQEHHVSAFEYLTTLLKHAEQIAARPADWMPWNYRSQVEPVKLERAA